jgi:hypothetical protein
MMKRISHTFEPAGLQREGLAERPEAWEDGQRAETVPGSFERWQFDARLSDGSLAAITFFTKPLLERGAPLQPGVAITIVPPDGRPLAEAISLPAEDFSASHERCYVRAGESWVRGDPQWNYELHARAGGLAAHLTFQGIAPAWRPGAGKFFAGAPGQEPAGYFAWLAGIPHGAVEGFLTYQGKIHPVKGTGYHDHRWGNLALNEVFTRWYLCRAQAGDFSLVFLELTGAPAYGEQKLPAILVTSGARQVASGCAGLTLEELEFQPDPGGRSYPAGLDGSWSEAGRSVRFRLRDPRLVDSFSLVDFLPTWKRVVGGLLTNPYQFTFSAALELEAAVDGASTRAKGQAFYELALLR